MSTNLNVAPYYDDFDETKGFHQILFRPGYAVQARELTQLQTILQKQIEKFGNHVFQHGSIVIPGNSLSELNVPYVKISSISNVITLNSFEGKTIVGQVSGVKAVVKKVISSTAIDPIVFYLAYISGGGTAGTEFLASEELLIEGTTINALIVDTAHSGFGSLVSINAGVYYINGYFVHVTKQTAVLDKFSNLPTKSVFLKITEEIVSSDDDSTLLDPAQGSYNYAAPGADRLRIYLDLVVYDINSAITEDLIEIMRYDNGELLEHSRYPKYSELEKSLARRTFDESGNYVVSGYRPSFREHLKENRNDGVYESPTGNKDKVVCEISTGKAYINGFEVEKISRTRIELDKARDSNHKKYKAQTFRPNFGQYIYVSNVSGPFSIKNRDIVTFYNDNDNTNSSAVIVGTARVIGIDYVSSLTALAGIYKVYISDVSIVEGYFNEDIGGMRFNSGADFAYVMTKYIAPISSLGYTVGELVTNTSGRTATVKYFDILTSELYVYKHDHTNLTPRLGDEMLGGTSGTKSIPTNKSVIINSGLNAPIFQFSVSVAASLLNTDLQYDLEYVTQKELVINTNASGLGSVTISSGVIDPIEDGTFIAISAAGPIPNTSFSLNDTGNTLTFSNVSYANAEIYIFASVTKTDVSPKTKTVTTVTENFANGIGIKTLGNCDVIELVSVIDNTGDITINYSLDNGQTEYAYNKGTISLSRGTAVGAIAVTYKYYNHSISGDFFCINSYSSNPDYLDKFAVFSSKTTGEMYNLYNCVDFRPSIGVSGYSGTGAKPIDLIVPDTIFRTELQHYVGRVDSLVIDKKGQPRIITGAPGVSPVSPNIPQGVFEISRFYIPPYTFSANSINHTRLDVNRFTMKDISGIVKRIERIEEFTTLTADEQSLTTFEITDAATGLSRYKTGYVVENFTSPLLLGRKTSLGWCASVTNNMLTAYRHETIVDLRVTGNSSHYQLASYFMTLPFTSEVIFQQNQSSRITNINPFMVIRWDGTLDVIPPRDDYVEVRELPTIYENVENITRETIHETIIVQPPPPAPEPPPAAPVDVGYYQPVYDTPAPAATSTPKVDAKIYQVTSGGGLTDQKSLTGFSNPLIGKTELNVKTGSGTVIFKDALTGAEKSIAVTATVATKNNPLGTVYDWKDSSGKLVVGLQPADLARAENLGYKSIDNDNISDGTYTLNKLDQWKK